MGSHPVNLTLRFLLELAALLALGIWGWQQSDGWPRFVLALAIPLVAAAIWALYATGYTSASLVLGIIVAVHYVASYDRIHWLLAH